MIVASNTSPLIFLAKIKRLDLIGKYEVVISFQVLEEIKKGKEAGQLDADIILELIDKKKIKIKNVKALTETDRFNISEGEKSAICLALRENALLIVDEKKARVIAKQLGLKVRGTLGIIAEAYDDKILSKEESKELIIRLVKAGYRIDEFLLLDFLRKFE